MDIRRLLFGYGRRRFLFRFFGNLLLALHNLFPGLFPLRRRRRNNFFSRRWRWRRRYLGTWWRRHRFTLRHRRQYWCNPLLFRTRRCSVYPGDDRTRR
jgi:hypothetical protein